MQLEQPLLKFVTCPGAAGAPHGAEPVDGTHRMAWWEWNATGDPAHPHVIVCVHGLSRQGRDFDELARALSHHARVVCPDVPGRGRSDWLQDPAQYGVPLYAADMLALIAQLHAEAPIARLDWVGTSMGGLIGLSLAGQPGLPLPCPVRRMVLNDVGPALQWQALQRIGSYLGRTVRFRSVEEAAQGLRLVSQGFGPHTDAQWHALTAPMLRQVGDAWELHYDPAIAVPFRAFTEQDAQSTEQVLWTLYDRLTADTLVLRGGDSDLLSPATARAMTDRGPHARVVEFPGVGHAPTLVAPDQIAAVRDFLLRPDDGREPAAG